MGEGGLSGAFLGGKRRSSQSPGEARKDSMKTGWICLDMEPAASKHCTGSTSQYIRYSTAQRSAAQHH